MTFAYICNEVRAHHDVKDVAWVLGTLPYDLKRQQEHRAESVVQFLNMASWCRGHSHGDVRLPLPPKPSMFTRYKEATYELPGPSSTEKGAESVKQTAAKIIAYFQANNYKIVKAGEEIT